MKKNINDSWTFEITSPENRIGAIEEGIPPVGDIRILTEKNTKRGDSPKREDSLFGHNLAKWANSIACLLDGESNIIEIDASDIHIYPKENQDIVKVCVDMHGVPSEARNYEPDYVDTEAFVREVYRTISLWVEDAKAINSDINEAEWFQDIETALANARQAMKESDIPIEDPS